MVGAGVFGQGWETQENAIFGLKRLDYKAKVWDDIVQALPDVYNDIPLSPTFETV